MRATTASIFGDGRERFPDLSTRELKKLFNHHSSITALSCLWSLGAAAAVLFVPTLLFGLAREGGEAEFLIAAVLFLIAVFQLITVIGCYRRDSWARTCGIVVCSVMLINVPIGTLLGILGLVAFIRGERLFGPDRYVGRELKAELKRRKKLKVA
jgi:hypothetical protein